MGDPMEEVAVTIKHDEDEEEFVPGIGQTVYFFSAKLNRVVMGTVEGYASTDWRQYKILEDQPNGSKIRHIVLWYKLRPTKQLAEQDRDELTEEERNLQEIQSMELRNGSVVYLRPKVGHPDVNCYEKTGEPIPYQVVAIYGRTGKVKLVTDYGEEVGTFPIEQIVKTDREPLFRKEQFQEGTLVTWVEGDDVLMGRISKVHEWTVDVVDICKLFPSDYKKRLPFYKIPDGRGQKPLPKITVVIDDKEETDLVRKSDSQPPDRYHREDRPQSDYVSAD